MVHHQSLEAPKAAASAAGKHQHSAECSHAVNTSVPSQVSTVKSAGEQHVKVLSAVTLTRQLSLSCSRHTQGPMRRAGNACMFVSQYQHSQLVTSLLRLWLVYKCLPSAMQQKNIGQEHSAVLDSLAYMCTHSTPHNLQDLALQDVIWLPNAGNTLTTISSTLQLCCLPL